MTGAILDKPQQDDIVQKKERISQNEHIANFALHYGLTGPSQVITQVIKQCKLHFVCVMYYYRISGFSCPLSWNNFLSYLFS